MHQDAWVLDRQSLHRFFSSLFGYAIGYYWNKRRGKIATNLIFSNLFLILADTYVGPSYYHILFYSGWRCQLSTQLTTLVGSYQQQTVPATHTEAAPGHSINNTHTEAPPGHSTSNTQYQQHTATLHDNSKATPHGSSKAMPHGSSCDTLLHHKGDC